MGIPTMWFPNRFDTNWAVQSQKMPRGWKFWIQKVEELYYSCIKNKGAVSLFSHMQIVGFLMRWLLGHCDTVSLFFMEIKWLKLRNCNCFRGAFTLGYFQQDFQLNSCENTRMMIKHAYFKELPGLSEPEANLNPLPDHHRVFPDTGY